MTVLSTQHDNIRQALVTVSAGRRGVPFVAEVLHEHIDLLTGVSPGQLTRYRNQVRSHMSGSLASARLRRVVSQVGIGGKAGYRWRAERGGIPPALVAEEARSGGAAADPFETRGVGV